MDKKRAIEILSQCGALYAENLVNQNYLILYGDISAPQQVELKFLPRNFQHLTGAVVAHGISSVQFYKKCRDRKLKASDFEFSPDGTTVLKLDVLPMLFAFHKNMKMIAQYNNSKFRLQTDTLTGGQRGCLGFVTDQSYCVPNTALKEDIRGIAQEPPKRILAMYRKAIQDKSYENMVYLAKGISQESLPIPTPKTACVGAGI